MITSPPLMPAKKAPRVLVLGGAGFIGRHAVTALLERGAQVVVGSRHPKRAGRRLPLLARQCERCQVRVEACVCPEDWLPPLTSFDVVVNCVGILRARGRETYDRVHHRAPAALASACGEQGIRLIHVSALGLDETRRSGFLSSKLLGEQAVMASDADWHLVRPSLLDGQGGFGARWIRRVANWPVHMVPANAQGRLAPVDVRDLGEAIAGLVFAPVNPDLSVDQRIYEVGGSEARTMAEHLDAMRTRRGNGTKARLPVWLARLASHVLDLLHLTPYSFGHYELLQHDNLPCPNRLPELLGRAPRIVGTNRQPAPAPKQIPDSGRVRAC